MKLTDKEKDLLVTYVDGNPSLDEIDEAQSLIKENEDARNFENILRNTKNVLIKEHYSAEFQNSIKSLMSLVKKKEPSIYDAFLNFFGLKVNTNSNFSIAQTGGGALAGVTFSIFFALFLSPDFFNQEKIGNINSYDFNETSIVKTKNINLRGESAIESTIQKTVSQMIDIKSIYGEVTDSDDIYTLTLVDYFEETDCYEGIIEFEDMRREFFICNRGEIDPIDFK